MQSVLLILITLIGSSFSPLWSKMSANEAKAQGLIAEKCDGYVKAIKPEGQEIAQSINAERKKEYIKIAQRDKVPVEAVETRTGKKLCSK